MMRRSGRHRRGRLLTPLLVFVGVFAGIALADRLRTASHSLAGTPR
jgi:hypothetical protein